MIERDDDTRDPAQDDVEDETSTPEEGSSSPTDEPEPTTPQSDDDGGGAQSADPEASDAGAGEEEGGADAPEEPAAPEDEPPHVEIVEPLSEQDELRAQLSQAQARLRTVSKAYTDLQAEMKAFRERMEGRAKVRSELQAFELAKIFFEPVMNLRRSVAQPGEDLEALISGLRMVQKQFMDALTRLGLEEIPGEGADFDPNLHEALAVTPVTDKAQDGKILMVHTAGYAVKGKVLQASQVVIGKYQEAAGEA